MIRYQLQCAKGHAFEGWFRSSGDFDAQAKKRHVTCPTCGTAKVEKALMAPSVVTSKAKSKRQHPATTDDATSEAPAAAPADTSPRLVATPEQREMLRQMREIRDQVLQKSDYVGPRFAEEARKIHSEETPSRGIHGEATPAEVKSLAEDGIEVYPVPILPDDQN